MGPLGVLPGSPEPWHRAGGLERENVVNIRTPYASTRPPKPVIFVCHKQGCGGPAPAVPFKTWFITSFILEVPTPSGYIGPATPDNHGNKPQYPKCYFREQCPALFHSVLSAYLCSVCAVSSMWDPVTDYPKTYTSETKHRLKVFQHRLQG